MISNKKVKTLITLKTFQHFQQAFSKKPVFLDLNIYKCCMETHQQTKKKAVFTVGNMPEKSRSLCGTAQMLQMHCWRKKK